MDTVRLGRTNLEVSVAGLGCGGHSRLGMATGHDEAHAARIVEHALDSGINFIDTARAYGTEPSVGKALRGKRDGVIVSTKASVRHGDELTSAAQLTESLELSLNSLESDYVDVFHLHGVVLDQYPHCRDVLLPEMRRQQQAGKIRFLGITEKFARDPSHLMLQAVLPDDQFDVAMVGFNVLNPSARTTVFPLTRQRDIATLNMFAVRRGLSHPDVLTELVEGLVADGRVDATDVDLDDPLAFARDHERGSSVIDAAYRYCRHEPGADVVLIGTGSAAHLDDNINAILAPPLPDDVISRLNRIFGDVDSVSGN